MSKKLKSLLVGVGVLAVLTACSDSEDIKTDGPAKEPTEVKEEVVVEPTPDPITLEVKEVVEQGIQLSLDTDKFLETGILIANVSYVGEEESVTVTHGGRLVGFQIKGLDDDFTMVSPMTMALMHTELKKGSIEPAQFEVGQEVLDQLKAGNRYEIIAEPGYSIEGAEMFVEKTNTILTVE